MSEPCRYMQIIRLQPARCNKTSFSGSSRCSRGSHGLEALAKTSKQLLSKKHQPWRVRCGLPKGRRMEWFPSALIRQGTTLHESLGAQKFVAFPFSRFRRGASNRLGFADDSRFGNRFARQQVLAVMPVYSLGKSGGPRGFLQLAPAMPTNEA